MLQASMLLLLVAHDQHLIQGQAIIGKFADVLHRHLVDWDVLWQAVVKVVGKVLHLKQPRTIKGVAPGPSQHSMQDVFEAR